MPLSLKHAFTSAKADGADATLIQPSNWNAEHVLTGLVETVTDAPSTSQNDYAPSGISTDAQVTTILIVSPSNPIKITGFSTSGWGAGKRLIVRNGTSLTASSAYMILIERESTSSVAANRVTCMGRIPIFLMPGDEVELRYDGTNLKVIGGNREFGTAKAFDACRPLTSSGSSWSVGTGSSSGQSNLGDDTYFRSRTGTTSTGVTVGGVTNVDSYVRAYWASKSTGAAMCYGKVWVSNLADVTDDYRVFIGFNSGDIPNFTGADAANPTDLIAYRYDRGVSANWAQITRSNGTANQTVTDTGVAVAALTALTFAIFVNGDGTRVDFYRSTDSGVTWTIGTSHTTNIPNSSARGMGLAMGIVKIAGTTTRDAYAILGGINWMTQ